MRLLGWFRPIYKGGKPPIYFMWREWRYRARRAWGRIYFPIAWLRYSFALRAARKQREPQSRPEGKL